MPSPVIQFMTPRALRLNVQQGLQQISRYRRQPDRNRVSAADPHEVSVHTLEDPSYVAPEAWVMAQIGKATRNTMPLSSNERFRDVPVPEDTPARTAQDRLALLVAPLHPAKHQL